MPNSNTTEISSDAVRDRRARHSLWVAGVAVLVLIVTGCRFEILDSPFLVHEGTIVTHPFTGTTVKTDDAEALAYVPADDTLWIADDNNDSLYEMDRTTGALLQTVTGADLAAAPLLGGGPLAGSNRKGDLEALAYDPVADQIFAFSGSCCSQSALPTAFRLTRSGPGGTFAVESYQPLNAGYNGAASTPAGVLYVSGGQNLRTYDYVTNVVSPPVSIPGTSGVIYGLGFSVDGEDLFIVDDDNELTRVDWATQTIVTDYEFSLDPWLGDARGVELVGSTLYVIDGDDDVPDNTPAKNAIHLFTIDGIERSPQLPVASFTATPATGVAPLTVTFDATASTDPDGTVTEWYWFFGDGTPLVAAGDVIVHEYTNPGTYNVGLWLVDDAQHIASTARVVTVEEPNTAPVLDPIGNQTVDETELLAFTATATDANLPPQVLTFTLDDGAAGAVPTGATITTSGDFTWTPTEAQDGPHTFDIVVTDDGTGTLEDRETITVTVADINTAPALDPVGNQTVDELAPLAFTATATDTDLPADTLTFTLDDGAAGAVPTGATITTSGDFTWTPTEAQDGPHTFDIVVTDDGTGTLEDRETITVTVADINTAPALDPVGNQVAVELTELAFTATATDTDLPADTLTFTLDDGAAGAVPTGAAITTSGDFSWTPTGAQLGVHTFDIVVTDDGTGTLEDRETIQVDVAAATQDQRSFRIRSDDTEALNANAGWAAATDTDATLATLDEELRIRFLLGGSGTSSEQYELWYRKDGGAWAAVPDNPNPWLASPAGTAQHEVQLVPSASFADGDATTALLGGAGTFVGGEGRETGPTGVITLADGEETEVEFNILIRKWSEDAHIDDGTEFEFQVRTGGGGQLGTYTETPKVTIANRAGHIGGAYVETAANPLVVDKDGNLYAVIEATDQSGGTFEAEVVIMKSADGGTSWTAPDLGARPGHKDIEAVDLHYVAADDTIHIAYQGPMGDNVYYVPFHTAAHPTSPDSYGTAELVDGSVDTIDGQAIAIRKRSTDGTVYVAYKDGDLTNSRVTLMRRDPTWGNAVTLDNTAGVDIQGAFMEIDSVGVIHVVYAELGGGASDGDLYHRSISTSDVLSARTQINDPATTLDGATASTRQPHGPPVVFDDAGTERIAVVFADDVEALHYTQSAVSSIAFTADELVSDAAVAVGSGGSNSTVAALAVDDVDDEAIALWVDDLDQTKLQTDTRVAASWSADSTARTGDDRIGWVRAIAFQHSVANGNQRVIGMLLDDHPDPGGTGGVMYAEIVRQ